jgi:hypothetical protein
MPPAVLFDLAHVLEEERAREGEGSMGFKVLVTGAAAPAGRSLLRELCSDELTVLGCDHESPSCPFEGLDADRCFCVHRSDDPEFVGDLVTLCIQHEVDVLVPMREDDLVALAPVRSLFEELGARVWLAPIPPRATRSQARRIVELGLRGRARIAMGAWLRRLAGREPGPSLA